MIAGSLFSGVGGLDHGLARAGFRHAFFCESDPWRRSVLAARWPGVPVYEDVCEVATGGRERPEPGVVGRDGVGAHAGRRGPGPAAGDDRVDLVAGGFPCQDVSVAGQRRGLAGARSGLFHEFARIAESLRPRWLLVENVPGLLSSNGGRDFGVVLATLADIGYGVAWRVLDSRFFGVPQRRRRVFIVGTVAVGDPRAAAQRSGQVLAVGTRCDRHPATGSQEGSSVTSALAGRSASRLDDQGTGQLIAEPQTFDWQAGGGGSDTSFRGKSRAWIDDKPGMARSLVKNKTLAVHIAAPLTSGSHPNSNAPGRRKEDDINLVAGPLGGGNDEIGRRSQDDPNLVAYALRRDITHSLTSAGTDASEDGTGRGTPLAAEGATVRRLTPTECERLQALPDGWTNPNGDAPDSRRYAALGDAVTASVGEWIGRRIIAANQETAA